MSRERRARIAKSAAAIALLASIVALGILVRLEDPLSSPVIPAEDPFTHMALVREHLADGKLDPLNNDGRLYPPGMHAAVAAVWVYTGIPLEDIFRFGPVVFGAIGIAGIALLLWRCHGPVAAIVGSLAAALAPEMIFRTNMMSPTALDLAILPFFLLAVLETLRGRLAWGGMVAAMSIFFVLAHPWLLAILAPMLLGIVVVWMVIGGARSESGAIHPVGAAIVLSSVAGALLLAINTCWSQCRIGGTSASSTAAEVNQMAGIAAFVAFGAAILLVFVRKQVAAWQTRKRKPHIAVRFVLSAILAAALVAVSVPAFEAGMPEHVKLPRMIGMPILGLAAVGFVLLPFVPTRAGLAGGALAAVTYPFVIYNPLNSPFWPHRTAVYLTVALAILVGIAASAIVSAVRWLVEVMVRRDSRPARMARRLRLVSVATILATTMVAAPVFADTPSSYASGWYRLYPECEYEGLREIAQEADDDTIIITGDWRPKLVMAAFAPDADNVWFDRSFFYSAERRDDTLVGLGLAGKDVVVVMDRHMRVEHPEVDTSFLADGNWTAMGPYCSGGMPGERLNAYGTEGRW